MNKTEEMVCPFCKGYFLYDPTDEEIICPICNNKITEEDIDYVLAEDTAGDDSKALPAQG